MKIPCEISVRSVIPAIKAAIAKELIEKYSLRQNLVAEALRMSQSAVSKYTRQVRGHAIEIGNIEELQPLINRMACLLVNRTSEREKFLRLFCQACLTVRKRGLMCQFCQKDLGAEMRDCSFCFTYMLCLGRQEV